MICSVNVEVADNGFIVTVFEKPESGSMYVEPTKYVGQKPSDVTRLVGELLKQNKEKPILGG